MICPNCQTINETGNVFCVNCGTTVSQAETVASSLPPTQLFQSPAPPPYNASNSIETAVLPVGQYNQSMHNFTPVAPAAQTQNGGKKKLFLIVGLVFAAFLLVGFGGFYLLSKNTASAEILPAHIGMFLQNTEKDKVVEIKKQDFTNAVDAAAKLLKDDALTSADEKPNLILYSDAKDIPLNDLRLIQLDSVKPDGNLKQLDFQAAPVENKPEMKRIRVPEGLANGKYAFAILDGYLDDGKHKFWAFEVKNSGKSGNDSELKSTTVSLKPKEAKEKSTTTQTTQPTQPTAVVSPPPGATVAFVNTTDVILRSGPSQTSGKIGKLSPGQKVYVVGYSNNYEYFYSRKTGQTFNSNYAQVQTENGRSGWVYRAFLR